MGRARVHARVRARVNSTLLLILPTVRVQFAPLQHSFFSLLAGHGQPVQDVIGHAGPYVHYAA